ncbi:dTDP-4-dehydrorhamnose reductase [Reyranella sp. CPCC 100927]|uniref:dTDP-4-dehydrorhamnose reductase n=1 Tax=Reyranella sp. CPCC 100927 TaxID=2599616 RepID=UPI0011B81F7A|nr:dTDP-4-dehydrorhamnose reductase [Reyranella sp. CPCC 100927]TWT12884.1 dTDP-4-dehydrorhamnose reductase [Reyranella sp. CPCC 100927]
MTLLVFGASGQLGHEIGGAVASRNLAAVLLSRADADIADRAAVVSAVEEARPSVVINAAAYTKVDKAEDESEQAYRENRDGPALLAEVCATRGLPLIHVSTDYVFDGSKPTPYIETDPVAPLGVYGTSKEAGERAIRERLERHVILRTAWVYGVHGNNFLKTMLNLARTKESWGVVADQRGNPTATADLADAILIAAVRADGRSNGVWGTYHFAGSGAATWHDFASEIVSAQAAVTGRQPEVRAITTADYPTRARRPANSCLDSTRFETVFGMKARPWAERTREVVAALLSTSTR